MPASGFGRSRSERVFRNEFPYLGRVGPAAWAGFRLVGGDGIVRNAARFRRAGPDACGAGSTGSCGAPEGQGGGPEGGSQGSRAEPPHRPPQAPAAGAPAAAAPAPGPAGSADLCALDQVLPEGPGRQRQAGLLHRQGRPHRVRPAGHRGRHHRARRRAEEDPARDAAARHAARARHPHHRRQQPAAAEPLCDLLRRTAACPTTKRRPN